jgi:outer membrane immunogenic protein
MLSGGLLFVWGESVFGVRVEVDMTLRALVGGVAFAAGIAFSICSAGAADLPPAPVPVAPVAYAPAAIYNWTGFYIGGHAGAGFANSAWSDPFTGANNTFGSGAGFLGGAQVGANYQFNRLVLGVEGDFSWTDLKGSGTDSIGSAIGTNTQWTSTVTGRVGAAFDRLLIYGKGGVAFAQDQSSFTDIFANGASTTFMRTGWTAGAGLEYGITKNWSAKIEYDYLGFGSQALNFTTPTTPLYTSNAGLNVQEIKAGVNFRFGGP